MRRGVAAAAPVRGSAEYMPGAFADDHHVRWRGADIRACRITAAQRFDDITHVAQRGGTLGGAERSPPRHGDDRLATAVAEPGHCALERYASRQAQGVVEPVATGRVTP